MIELITFEILSIEINSKNYVRFEDYTKELERFKIQY